MQITIDNEGASYRAKLTIDGKTVEVSATGIEGLSKFDAESLGGLIALRLRYTIIRILQAEAFAAEAQGQVDTRSFTWDRLNRGALLAAKEQLSQ